MDEISHTVKNHSKLKITKNNNLKKEMKSLPQTRIFKSKYLFDISNSDLSTSTILGCKVKEMVTKT